MARGSTGLYQDRGEPFHLDQSAPRELQARLVDYGIVSSPFNVLLAIKALSPLIRCDLRAIGYALAKINLQVLI
jgi:hypothetical protein